MAGKNDQKQGRETGFKNTLKDWRDEFYEDSATISTLIRNINFAGIGLIWIFKNSNLTLPPSLYPPLEFIVFSLMADVAQYLWRVITIYFRYLKIERRHKKQSDNGHALNVSMPDYIRIGTWIIWGIKIVLCVIAFYYIYNYLTCRTA